MPAVSINEIAEAVPGEPSATVRERVLAARAFRAARPAGTTKPDAKAKALLRQAAEKLHLSARGYDRVLKVARTIADMGGSHEVQRDHVAEALQYRLLE